MIGEALAGGLEVVPPQRLDYSGVMLGGKCHSARLPEVAAHIPAGNLPKLGDHGQQAAVGTSLKESAVPLFVQRNTAVSVAPGECQLAIDLAQPGQPLGWNLAGELQCQPLQRRQDGAGLTHLGRVQAADTEPAAHVRLQDAFTDQPEQCFADRRPADAQLDGNLGVAHPRAGRELAAVDAVEQLAVDLVTQRGSGDDKGCPW